MSELEKKLDNLKLTDEEIITQIQGEYNNAIEYRRPRINDWHANEDMLYGKKPVTLSKRSNIDLRLMKGLEDTLLAKIKNPPIVKYERVEEADVIKARKVTALWELESSPTHQDWSYKDLLEKKLSLPSGRAIKKIFSQGEPYKHVRETVDHYDFLIDPLAGGYDIEKARYLGQDNIFKSKYDLEDNETYNQTRVKELLESTNQNESDVIDNEHSEKQNRFAVLGLNPNDYNAQADGLYKLIEWYTTINGVRYYFLVSLSKKVIIKKRLLEDMVGIFEEDGKPLWPFSSWAYYPDMFNFWSPSPMDIVRENFQTRNIVINQAIDNNEAKNKPMKSYDPDTYKYPELLEYEPDRLIPTANGKDPKTGLYIHETASIYDPKVLNEMLEDIAAKVTGITPAGQGVEEKDQKVGIYFGNQQETASRNGLFDLSYSRSNSRDALLYLNGLKYKLDEEIAVKMIGENGAEWDKLRKEDLGEFDITITGGSAQSQLDAMKAKQKSEFIDKNIGNVLINQKALIEQQALISGFTPDEIKKLLSKEDASDESIAKASEDIQKIIQGKDLRPNKKADLAYYKHISEFFDETELTEEQETAFKIYLDAIEEIVIDNSIKKAQKELAMQGKLQVPDVAIPTESPIQVPSNGDTISRASEFTNDLKPRYESAKPIV